MNNVQVFNFERNDIRTVMVDNEPYFVGKDVAAVLGYSNTRDALAKHCKAKAYFSIYDGSQNREMAVISSGDVLSLISKAVKAPEDLRIKFTDFLVNKGLIQDKLFYRTRKEIEFIDTLCALLEPFGYEVVPQCNIAGYKVDLYIKDLNVVIEYDENGHSGYSYDQHNGRQKTIESEIGCNFIRVTDRDTHLWNCGYIMKLLMDF